MLKTLKLSALAAVLTLLGAGRAFAASSATINIDVTIQASLSVSVDGGQSSTATAVSWNTATPNAKFVSAATSTVRNDSGALTEKWALSSDATSLDQGTGGAWTLATSSTAVGADAFALQAVFGSSNTAAGGCPGTASTDWDQGFAPLLTSSPVTYTSAVFADGSLNAGGNVALHLDEPDTNSGIHDGRMLAGSKRALCWRVITPNSTSTVDTQNIQIIVTAVAP